MVAVTEAVVARAAGNYATVDAIAEDVRRKLGGNTIGLVFPILSRNRFAICLRGIARGARKVVVQLGYPSDEVGNHLVDIDALDDSGIDPYKDVLSVAEFRRHFGTPLHPFTAVLDVTDPEPSPEGHPFYGMDNVILTPHIAGSVGAECFRMGAWMLDEARRWLSGEPLRYEVTEKMLATMA